MGGISVHGKGQIDGGVQTGEVQAGKDARGGQHILPAVPLEGGRGLRGFWGFYLRHLVKLFWRFFEFVKKIEIDRLKFFRLCFVVLGCFGSLMGTHLEGLLLW